MAFNNNNNNDPVQVLPPPPPQPEPNYPSPTINQLSAPHASTQTLREYVNSLIREDQIKAAAPSKERTQRRLTKL